MLDNATKERNQTFSKLALGFDSETLHSIAAAYAAAVIAEVPHCHGATLMQESLNNKGQR